MDDQLCLKWNNHSTVFNEQLQEIFLKEHYSDATIMCYGKFYPVHQFVLTMCSEYFKEVFDKCFKFNRKNPFIIIKDIDPEQLEDLLEYMYKGKVNVIHESLSKLMNAAEALKIKGLTVSSEVESLSREKRKEYHTYIPTTASKKMKGNEDYILENEDNDLENDLSSISSRCSDVSTSGPMITATPNNASEEFFPKITYIPIALAAESDPLESISRNINESKDVTIPKNQDSMLFEPDDIDELSIKPIKEESDIDIESYEMDGNPETKNFEASNEKFDYGQNLSWDEHEEIVGGDNNEEDSMNRITMMNMKLLSDYELVTMTVRKLNKVLTTMSRDEQTYYKKRRRTLKNRAYASSCRYKKITRVKELQNKNRLLLEENKRLQKKSTLIPKTDKIASSSKS